MNTEGKVFFAAILIIGTLLASVGQLSFKFGVDYSVISVPYIILGFVLYGLSTLLYLFVLGRSHLSWAYSFTGLTYIFTNILALFVLNESITMLRWAGIAAIAIGAAIVSRS